MMHVQKPPIGLIREDRYEEAKNKERIGDIIDAIERVALGSGCPIICDWLPELRRRIDKINHAYEWR